MQQQHNPFKIYSYYVIPLIEISAMTSHLSESQPACCSSQGLQSRPPSPLIVSSTWSLVLTILAPLLFPKHIRYNIPSFLYLCYFLYLEHSSPRHLHGLLFENLCWNVTVSVRDSWIILFKIATQWHTNCHLFPPLFSSIALNTIQHPVHFIYVFVYCLSLPLGCKFHQPGIICSLCILSTWECVWAQSRHSISICEWIKQTITKSL